MDIERIEPGDVLYVNHHVAEPQLVDADATSEPLADFSERSAEVTVEEIREDEGLVIVTEKPAERAERWALKPGHLLRRWDPDSSDK